jgi:hypothetical protein
MGALNNLFKSTESIAKEIELDDETIRKQWDDYKNTITSKHNILNRLHYDKAMASNLKELKRLLNLELIDIKGEEVSEQELIKDLDSMEHSEKMRRVRRLYDALCYTKTEYEYMYARLAHLYAALKNQMHIVDKLLGKPANPEELIAHLKKQAEIEREIVNPNEPNESFHGLFVSLVKGEHVIQRLSAEEKELVKKMLNELKGEKKGIIIKWVNTVEKQVEDIIRDHEVLLKAGYNPHPDIHFEFVNNPDFVELARKTGQKIKGNISQQELNAFVHLFREWFNHVKY